MKAEIEQVRGMILSKYRSIHAFCQNHQELKRASVYLVMSGKYPGRLSAQLAKIKESLGQNLDSAVNKPLFINPQDLGDKLQACKCQFCKRQDRRGCRGCRTQTARELQVLTEYLTTLG